MGNDRGDFRSYPKSGHQLAAAQCPLGANLNQSLVELFAIWWRHFNRVGLKFICMTRPLADVIVEVLDELGANEAHPIHRSVLTPIIERRCRSLRNNFDATKDFRKTINAELMRFGPKSIEWSPKLFRMHGSGYWSVRNDAPRGFEQKRRKEIEELWISIHT
jgi:hypothetical protein